MSEIYKLLGTERHVVNVPSTNTGQNIHLAFNHIQRSLGAAVQSKDPSEADATQIDVQSCIHFLIDLYKQWLQNPVLITLIDC